MLPRRRHVAIAGILLAGCASTVDFVAETSAPPTTATASTSTTTTAAVPATNTTILNMPIRVVGTAPSTSPTTEVATTEAPTTTIAVTTSTAAAGIAAAAELPPSAPVAPPPTEPPVTQPTTALGAPVEGSRIGSIEIPRIGLNQPMFEGISVATLNQGPGHWPGTAQPGAIGNAVIGGHRTSKTRPFRHLDKLVAGDEVIFTTDAGRFVYRVLRTDILTPDATWIVVQHPTAAIATLFACHPVGSTSHRIVVFLELVV